MKLLKELLNKLERNWNDKYMLFADNGTLVLVRRFDGLVIKTFPRIICDGGDPDHENIGDDEYIMQT